MAGTTGKWRGRMKNNADVTRIVTYNCRKMAICCFLLLCIKVSWRHLANLKQMLRICALPALDMSLIFNGLCRCQRHILLCDFGSHILYSYCNVVKIAKKINESDCNNFRSQFWKTTIDTVDLEFTY